MTPSVPDALIFPVVERREIVVVARLVVEVEVSVPVVKEEVVALVAVRLVKNPVTAVKSEAKKLSVRRSVTVVEARVVVPSTRRLVPTVSPCVVEALATESLSTTLRVVIVEEEIVVVASVLVPPTVRVPSTEADEVAVRVPTVVELVRSVVMSPLVE